MMGSPQERQASTTILQKNYSDFEMSRKNHKKKRASTMQADYERGAQSNTGLIPSFFRRSLSKETATENISKQVATPYSRSRERQTREE
jgi:hypothetical protein